MRIEARGLPLSLDLEGQKVLLVGKCDAETARKREFCIEAGAMVQAEHAFSAADLDGARLVLLAERDPKLAARRATWEAQAAPLRGLKVVTYHKSWSYLSRWLGLEEIGYVEPKPGIPAPPSHIAALINLMRRENVRVLLMESFYPRNTVELVAQKSGARAVVLPSDVGADNTVVDYFSLVDRVLQKLTDAAK